MFIEMKITGYHDEPSMQELLSALGKIQSEGVRVPEVAQPVTMTIDGHVETHVAVNDAIANDKYEEFHVEVKEALDKDEKEAMKRVRPSRAKPRPEVIEEETVRVVTDVDLRMKAKSLLDAGKRDALIAALAEFKNGEFPKVSDIKDPDNRLEFMVVLEAL